MQIAWRSPSMVRIVGSATPPMPLRWGCASCTRSSTSCRRSAWRRTSCCRATRRAASGWRWTGRAMRARAAEALARFGIDHIDVTARAGSLSTGDRMLTVLAGLLATDDTPPSVFVMDEPTAALTHAEADRLFAVIAELKARGAGILYVSHRMAEVVEIADRVTVLRDGRGGAELPDGGDLEGRDHRRDDGAVDGRRLSEAPGGHRTGAGEGAGGRGLSAGPVRDVDFALRRGEILGIAGLEGAGQSDILRAILGDLRPRAGHVRLGGESGPRSAAEGWARGIAYVPRERRREGLMLGRGIAPNVVLPHLARLSRMGLWSPGRCRTGGGRGARPRGAAEIRPAGAERGDAFGREPAEGGFRPRGRRARRAWRFWMSRRAASMWARAPTSTRMIRRLSSAGTSVVMASSDLPELYGHVRPDRDPQRRAAGGDRGDRRPVTRAAAVDDLWRPGGGGVA
jgi:ribose transport system ATP-binding protein